MKPKNKAAIKKLHDQFLALRIKKRDADTGQVIEPAIPHDAFDHLHEGADPLDEMMTYCPLCNQDMIMRKIMAQVEQDV